MSQVVGEHPKELLPSSPYIKGLPAEKQDNIESNVDIIVSLCPSQLSEDVADVPRRKAHETFVLVCEKRLVGRLLQSFSASKKAVSEAILGSGPRAVPVAAIPSANGDRMYQYQDLGKKVALMKAATSQNHETCNPPTVLSFVPFAKLQSHYAYPSPVA